MPWGENPVVTFKMKIPFNLREALTTFTQLQPFSGPGQLGESSKLVRAVRVLCSPYAPKALLGAEKNTAFLFILVLFLMRNLG